MKHTLVWNVVAALLFTQVAVADNANKEAPPAQQKMSQADIDKLSEAFGHFIGRNLNAPGVKFNLDRIIGGIREGYAGKPAPMSEQEYETMMGQLQQQVFDQLAQDNLSAANTFLADNAKAAGVFELEPGKLQYMVLKEGKGPQVKAEDTPMINYVGKYLDGQVFDSSESSGGPVKIPLQQTIPGFSRGIVGMKEGEKRKIFVHPDMGYGMNSPLPPNAMLIFEIEVVKANAPDDKPAPGVSAKPAK